MDGNMGFTTQANMNRNAELTAQEKKLVRTCCFLPGCLLADIVLLPAEAVITVLMIMIGDIKFEADWGGILPRFIPLIIVAIFFVIFFVVILQICKHIMKGEQWQTIVSKVPNAHHRSDADELRRAVQNPRAYRRTVRSFGLLINIVLYLYDEATAVADAAGVPRLKAKAVCIPVVTIIAILSIVYHIPAYMAGTQNTQERADNISTYEDLIASAFSDIGQTSSDDISKYQTFYEIRLDENNNDYLLITADTDGIIQDVTYYAYVDPEAEKEDNLAHAEEVFSLMHERLCSCGIPGTDESVFAEPTLSEEFRAEFIAGDYEEPFSVRQNNGRCSYDYTGSDYEYAVKWESLNISISIP